MQATPALPSFLTHRSLRLPTLGLLLAVAAGACSDEGTSEPEFAADLEVSVLLDGEARSGEEVRVLVRVINNGPDVAPQVSMELDLPQGVSVVEVENDGAQSGNTVSWSGTGALEPVQVRLVGVRVLLEAAGEADFVGRASSTIADPDPSNNDDVPFTVQVAAVTETDLVVDLEAPTTALPGGEIEYRVITRNDGTIPAEDVVARLQLESGQEVLDVSDGGTLIGQTVEWPSVSALAAGESLTRTARVRMPYTGTVRARASAETSTDETGVSNSNGSAAHSRSTAFPALELLGELAPEGAFFTVAVGGDLDDDGVRDLLVAAPTGADGAGVVYALSTVTGQEIWSAAGEAEQGRLGTSLDSGVDVDADGTEDVLAGAPGMVGDDGGALLLSGADGSILARFSPEAEEERLGLEVALLTDVDGDGVPDVALSAPQALVGTNTTGVVRTFSGADGSLVDSNPGPAGVELFGLPMTSAGDLDGDGTWDLVVGAGDGYRGVSGASGEILFGPLAQEPALASFVRTGGDLDGDGLDEVLIPDPFAAGGAGQVWILSGAGAVLDVLDAPTPGENFGAAVSSAPDMDDDGVPELLVGAPTAAAGPENGGVVHVYSGADRSLLLTHVGATAEGFIGQDVHSPGDVDGDGIPDLVVLTGSDPVTILILKGVPISP